MKDLVIFMTNIPFMKHHVQDMYVNEISDAFSTELWDLSPLYGTYSNNEVLNRVKVINSERALFDNLALIVKENRVVIITNILNRNLQPIYKTIKRFSIPIVNINKDSLAGSLGERGSFHFIKYYSLKAQIYTIARHFPIFKQYFRKRLYGELQYDYLLGGANYFPFQTKCFMRIHQIKYDEYLKARTSDRIVKEKYILYIGSAPTSHPGYIGRNNSLNHSRYMGVIKTHLDRIEQEFGYKVVISGHPKGRYVPEEWGNREIFIGNTADLIHHCEGVICHFSTSLVNCILDYKPLQIVYDSEILKSAFRSSMVMGMELGRLCDADLCDMSKPHNWIMNVNKAAYDKFLYSEIINLEHKDKSDAELIRIYINRIFNEFDEIYCK